MSYDIYTSRTEIEAWQVCRRLYFYRQVYNAMKGIVPSFGSVPLVTGSAVHKGVEFLTKALVEEEEPNPTKAAKVAMDYYKTQLSQEFGDTTPSQYAETVQEQTILAMNLVKMWAKQELPLLQKDFILYESEQDIAFPLVNVEGLPPVTFMAKADATLLSRESREMYTYSLKTTADYSERMSNSYMVDLQGLTEALAQRIEIKRTNRIKEAKLAEIKDWYFNGPLTPERKAEAKERAIDVGRPITEAVMGIRYCFLVKGRRTKVYDAEGQYLGKVQDSPLVRGFSYQTPLGMEFAHSNKTIKPENKSGFGLLGKGWEEFRLGKGGRISRIIEERTKKSPGSGWFEMITSGEIQPELGNLAEQTVVVPTPRWPNEMELKSTLVQIKEMGKEIAIATKGYLEAPPDKKLLARDKHFPQTRRSCYFPLECPMISACHKHHPETNLLDTGDYVERKPHHETEIEARD